MTGILNSAYLVFHGLLSLLCMIKLLHPHKETLSGGSARPGMWIHRIYGICMDLLKKFYFTTWLIACHYQAFIYSKIHVSLTAGPVHAHAVRSSNLFLHGQESVYTQHLRSKYGRLRPENGTNSVTIASDLRRAAWIWWESQLLQDLGKSMLTAREYLERLSKICWSANSCVNMKALFGRDRWELDVRHHEGAPQIESMASSASIFSLHQLARRIEAYQCLSYHKIE